MPENSVLALLPERPANPDGQYRVLLVHAHPDDETITTGATIGALSDQGAMVIVLTCTRGELGEVVPEDLRYLEQGWPKQGRSLPLGMQPNDDGGLALAQVREDEWAQALAALGAHGEFLGVGQAQAPTLPAMWFQDSGMQWGSDGKAHPAQQIFEHSLYLADLELAASHAACLLRRVRPDAVITYQADGGYGHPDHIKAHLIAHSAVRMAAAGGDAFNGPWRTPLVHEVRSDDQGIAVVGNLDKKRRAMEAYRTQLTVSGDRYALSDGRPRQLSATERFDTVRKQRTGEMKPFPKALLTLLIAAVGGVVVGFLGTMLHLRGAESAFPWGAALALLFLGAMMTLLSVRSKQPFAGFVCGAVTYGTLTLLSSPHPQVGLIVNNVAGRTWVYGSAALTALAAIVAVIVVLGRTVRRRRTT